MTHRKRRKAQRAKGTPRTYDRHHRKSRNAGGSNEADNISIVRRSQHEAFHFLFATMSPFEIAKLLSNVWIDKNFKMIAVRR